MTRWIKEKVVELGPDFAGYIVILIILVLVAVFKPM